MPLIQGFSDSAVSKNIEILIKEGKSEKQAIAIAMDIAKKAKKKSKK